MGSAPVDRFLLDTHVWIWLANGADGLRPSTLEAIRQAAQESRLAISAISLWEVAMLAAKGRLHFHVDVQDWIDVSLSQIGLQIVPISPQIAVASTRLPGELHQDPADRLIVATARTEQMCLITRDGLILRYAAQGLVRVMEI